MARPKLNNVLVLEDEPFIAFAIGEALEDAKIAAVLVSTNHEALCALADQGFDAAILDIELKEGTSEAIADILRERGIPFVVCTGLSPGDFGAGFASAPVMYKPASEVKLIEALRTVLHLNEQSQSSLSLSARCQTS